jgi:hypothetical protein
MNSKQGVKCINYECIPDAKRCSSNRVYEGKMVVFIIRSSNSTSKDSRTRVQSRVLLYKILHSNDIIKILKILNIINIKTITNITNIYNIITIVNIINITNKINILKISNISKISNILNISKITADMAQ